MDRKDPRPIAEEAADAVSPQWPCRDGSYDALKLSNQLCFPLYACARSMMKIYKPYLDEIGLTYTQYIAMMVLWERRRVSAKELGRRLFLDSGTLTPLLKRLEAKGLLSRRRDPADERSLLATITEEGEALKEKAISLPCRIAEKSVLSQEEAETLYRTLYKLLREVEN